MQEKLNEVLNDPDARRRIEDDVLGTLSSIGVEDTETLTAWVFAQLDSGRPLAEIEQAIFEEFSKVRDGVRKSVLALLDAGLENRADIIFNQIRLDVLQSAGKVLDFGAGDGQVTQKLKDDGHEIQGVDVRAYTAEGVEEGLVLKYDGKKTDFPDATFDTITATNVFHHEEDNQVCLDECYRLLKKGGQLIVIETVPVQDTPEEWGRTFFNDWFYNRPFHPTADVPVPGTYETPENWRKRFEQTGFTVVSEEDLGVDIPVIPDRHYKFVLEK